MNHPDDLIMLAVKWLARYGFAELIAHGVRVVYHTPETCLPAGERFWKQEAGAPISGFLLCEYPDDTADLVIVAGGMAYRDTGGTVHYGYGSVCSVPYGTGPGQWEYEEK